MPVYLVAILQGLVEGLTEFLPVSSTGHLVLTDRIFHFQELLQSADRAELFEVVIQLGAILAIGVLYRTQLTQSFFARSASSESGRLRTNLLVAFLPAAILGFAFHKVIKNFLFSPMSIGISLFVGGVIILLIEKNTKEEKRTITLESMTVGDALVVGLAQVFSLIPGTSRSAATIMGGLLRGIKRPSATEFSFLLAFPVMIAASGYELLKYHDLLTKDMLGVLAVGFVVSFIVALGVVAWFIKFAQRHKFTGFGVYRIAFGMLVIVLSAMKYLT